MKMLYNETMEVARFINRPADSVSVRWLEIFFFLEKSMFKFSLEDE